MLVIPAIDIKDGKCVRLVKGDFDKQSIYNESPVNQAKVWKEKGARLIHIVDLDGALEGKPVNLDVIKQITQSVDCPIQIGGGVRNMNIIDEWVKAGVDRIIVGTQAYKEPGFVREACKKHPNKIIIGIDVVDGNVAVNGWKEITGTDGIDFALQMEDYGVFEFIITDINRDGMLTGINTAFYEKFLEKINIPVIASGGVCSIDDVEKLNELSPKGLIGVVIGKALYEKRFTLEQVLEVVKNAG